MLKAIHNLLKCHGKACLAIRKNVKNSLIQSGFSKEYVIKTLKDLNIDENIRGEKLSLETINSIAKNYNVKISAGSTTVECTRK